MPVTWDHLPNEVQRMIITYVIAGHVLTLAPQFPVRLGLYGRRPLLRLQLVSKQFLKSIDVNDTVLRYATVNLQSCFDITRIYDRFGSEGIANIRSLQTTGVKIWECVWTMHHSASGILSMLKRLERMILDDGDTHHSFTRGCQNPTMDYDIDVVSAILNGQISDASGDLPQTGARVDEVQNATQMIFNGFLQSLDDRAMWWIQKFLDRATEHPVEKTIQFGVDNSKNNYRGCKTELVEYSSKSRCCTFLRKPAMLLPQRITEELVNFYPTLRTINEAPSLMAMRETQPGGESISGD